MQGTFVRLGNGSVLPYWQELGSWITGAHSLHSGVLKRCVIIGGVDARNDPSRPLDTPPLSAPPL